MTIERDDRQPQAESLPGTRAESEDDGVVIPGSAPPLSPGRTDVNPDDQPGVDELPGNELERPRDGADGVPMERQTPDIDVDNAEMDDAPNPR
ncbi:hypothetical protein CH92_11065 [Stutzerimonas stutzeri]|uniref:Uncharacterized protein n=1 Tax=Stutzerimonas stutzeri TaxID=316 RepID=W8QZ86_STUST|nr:hypothetical protein [Stutzerimonas stutzeri]AHL75614.1 hypothetical protein CH92_11065 [Stutzerimonas stutzeri]MCQ4327808.1 hypothetical protein [Stutzerimonas stutzeri]